MPEVRHWIIAYAAPPDGTDIPIPPLPALQRWLARAVPHASYDGDPWSLTPPHEHALARALGWSIEDGRLPWAAWHAGRAGVACAWLWPCAWQAGLDHITLIPPQALDLRPDEAVALKAAFAPYAAADGIALDDDGTPGRWLAEGDLFDGWTGASLDRVAHRRADVWWRDAGSQPSARTLLRLLNEAQMLFHDHPVNAARVARGALPINGLWISGAGRWRGDGPRPAEASVQLIDALVEPGTRGDAPGWAAGWQALEPALADWMAAADADGQPRWLTLCGERGWRTWRLDPGADPAPCPRRGWRDWWQRLRGRPATPAAAVLDWWSGL
ncbi:phosphoglycerate mutase [Tepidimonas sp.]|uniref:phosphoglycerate mutase n=1 Tax=Tepidimonas sp. TaxID=2002775 RepID=UPI0028CC63DB|nr:phosphoglycerate mutase [Tepidimonas sp.]MDT7928658.1 phosphoglycerate mutase [Tepidimonas sp.]